MEVITCRHHEPKLLFENGIMAWLRIIITELHLQSGSGRSLGSSRDASASMTLPFNSPYCVVQFSFKNFLLSVHVWKFHESICHPPIPTILAYGPMQMRSSHFLLIMPVERQMLHPTGKAVN